MDAKTKEAWRIVVLSLILVVAGIAAVIDIVLLNSSLTPWWIPVLCVLPIALCLYLPFRGLIRWLTRSSKIWINLSVNLVLCLSFLLAAVLLINLLNPKDLSSGIYGTVNKVYKETRYRTKRVSRRTYTKGTPYQVTCMDITLETGDNFKIDIPMHLYDVIGKGDTIDLPVVTGVFNITMIDKAKAAARHPRPLRHKTRHVGKKLIKSSDEVHMLHKQRIDSIREKYYHHK